MASTLALFLEVDDVDDPETEEADSSPAAAAADTAGVDDPDPDAPGVSVSVEAEMCATTASRSSAGVVDEEAEDRLRGEGSAS